MPRWARHDAPTQVEGLGRLDRPAECREGDVTVQAEGNTGPMA